MLAVKGIAIKARCCNDGNGRRAGDINRYENPYEEGE